ncbi:hypothetical protein [Agrococcus carbonis]|uniref:Uncharacterized protein n=1 Tax=Agrococcus carbonis TaxID=684552 RepID=A0A1H1PYG5_9MICO|nr:hypothetical protein [Agrococcus carbonis]SDS16017.1 hypothetical protein SAMN04489719_1677 [Agrococcus carbonis]
MHPTPPAASEPAASEPLASGPPLTVTAWVAIVAPLVALVLKGLVPGWLIFFAVLWSPVLLIGYALLVVAAARGMLRRRGVLRRPERRVRARMWAWLTSVGVVLFGATIVDGGDTTESLQSLLTVLLGSPTTPSPAHDASAAIAWAAAAAWLVGWLALMVEWAVAVIAVRAPVPRVAPPRV